MNATALLEYPDMMLEDATGEYEIRTHPNPVLTEKAAAIAPEEFGIEIERIGNQMIALVRKHDGLGLAATQIGLLKRMFVMNFPNKTHDPQDPAILCNPVIEEMSKEGSYGREGCLSLPGVVEQVWRASKVFIRYQTPSGEERSIGLLDLEARIALHEVDHLDGINFYQRVSRQVRRSLLAKYEKIRR